MSDIKTRKLPKKTIYIIVSLVILAFVIMYAEAHFKERKIGVYLHSLGYKNIENIKVFSKSKVKDKETQRNLQLYKIKFVDLNKNKKCVGLMLIDLKNDVSVDLDCRKMK